MLVKYGLTPSSLGNGMDTGLSVGGDYKYSKDGKKLPWMGMKGPFRALKGYG